MRRNCAKPLVTIAVPSLNQGPFLDDALQSIFGQQVPVEVFVADGGSSDHSIAVIQQWAPKLSGWRSHPDRGQANAINECIARGSAPYVAWLNSDDIYLPGGLRTLIDELEKYPGCQMAYGNAWNIDSARKRMSNVWVQPFSESRLATRCIISQPATIIRRPAWEAIGGLDENLHLAPDYDLWWRMFRKYGFPAYVESAVAANRIHPRTKTQVYRRQQHIESIAVVRRHHGSVPLKWWMSWPFSVWARSRLSSRHQ